MGDTTIQPLPPSDCKDYDCQCARCGSSCDSEWCDTCGNEGFIFSDEFDYDVEEVTITCPECNGNPVVYRCLSSREWCKSNPMTGRENVERGKIEWFEVERKGDAA